MGIIISLNTGGNWFNLELMRMAMLQGTDHS
jgi:hypothetical protein